MDSINIKRLIQSIDLSRSIASIGHKTINSKIRFSRICGSIESVIRKVLFEHWPLLI